MHKGARYPWSYLSIGHHDSMISVHVARRIRVEVVEISIGSYCKRD